MILAGSQNLFALLFGFFQETDVAIGLSLPEVLTLPDYTHWFYNNVLFWANGSAAYYFEQSSIVPFLYQGQGISNLRRCFIMTDRSVKAYNCRDNLKYHQYVCEQRKLNNPLIKSKPIRPKPLPTDNEGRPISNTILRDAFRFSKSEHSYTKPSVIYNRTFGLSLGSRFIQCSKTHFNKDFLACGSQSNCFEKTSESKMCLLSSTSSSITSKTHIDGYQKSN